MKADGVSEYCGHFNISYQAAEPIVVLQNNIGFAIITTDTHEWIVRNSRTCCVKWKNNGVQFLGLMCCMKRNEQKCQKLTSAAQEVVGRIVVE